MSHEDHAFAATVASVAPEEGDRPLSDDVALEAGPEAALPRSGRATGTVRTAVLPRVAGEALVHDGRERYAIKRVLGAGAMGEVALAEDQDIGRPVALKYLLAPGDEALVARFVEEIHTVGSLEHPNIVPIHDVGVDEQGRYFFVMKHIEGETVEAIIAKLRAGDRAYHERFTFTARVQLFMSMLRALQFAHARGFVHRDIKPANVMIGKFGEVVLMDWGVAKPTKSTSSTRDEAEPAEPPVTSERARMFTTRRGALVGTPAYMSPEQARGDLDAIDTRSDLFGACVLFHELLTLHHYLEGCNSLVDMLRAVIAADVNCMSFSNIIAAQGPAPAELLHFCTRGLRREPNERFQTAEQMIERLAATLDGRVKVQCPVTLTKRITREAGRFVDRHPLLGILGAAGVVLLVVWTFVSTALLLAR